MSRVYQAFDGDFVAAIALGETAHRDVEAWLADQQNPEEALDDPSQRMNAMRPCNALSIARGCGLPRETVGRKVVMLVERGYIYRTYEDHLYFTTTAGDGFEDMNAQLIEELLAAALRLESLLTVQPTPPGPPRSD